jgi:hypothetical protein
MGTNEIRTANIRAVNGQIHSKESTRADTDLAKQNEPLCQERAGEVSIQSGGFSSTSPCCLNKFSYCRFVVRQLERTLGGQTF